jgi:hypothetical protein
VREELRIAELGLRNSQKEPETADVIPAKAGIHWLQSNKLQNGFPLSRE